MADEQVAVIEGPGGKAEIIEVGEGAELHIIVVGEQLKTVRSTVDDLLACLAAAESSLDVSE